MKACPLFWDAESREGAGGAPLPALGAWRVTIASAQRQDLVRAEQRALPGLSVQAAGPGPPALYRTWLPRPHSLQ